jgi:hypothetical protein
LYFDTFVVEEYGQEDIIWICDHGFTAICFCPTGTGFATVVSFLLSVLLLGDNGVLTLRSTRRWGEDNDGFTTLSFLRFRDVGGDTFPLGSEETSPLQSMLASFPI